MANFDTPRPVVVFVHGFLSSPRCWTSAGRPRRRWALWGYRGPLIGDIAASDGALDCDLDYFKYETRLFQLNPLQKIPPISQIGEQLKTWLQANEYHRRPTTLIGHSQGGLVILSYLALMLENKEASILEHVRQVILIATPQKGSLLLSTTRNLVGRLLGNIQEERMRVFSESVDKMLATITRDIINADRQSESTWPVPIHAFYGTEDRVVVKESARGELDPGTVDALAGDHFRVLRPINSADPKYRTIRNSILQPIGHKRVFLIERYDTSIIVAPESRVEKIRFKNREKRVNVLSVGRVDRSVLFSERNVCEEFFVIRYRTLCPDGYLNYSSGGSREGTGITAAALQEYQDEGRQIRFSTRPIRRRRDECFLNVVVFNGFNPGNTSAHFHLRPPDEPMRVIECLSYLLDLSAYVREGFEIREVELYLHPRDPSTCDELCRSRVASSWREPESSDPAQGIWKWNLYGVRGGVVDVFWDVGSVQPHA